VFLLTFIRKLYKVLSSDSSPSAIAVAVAFGVLAGCVPVTCGLSLFMLLLVLVFRVQIAAALFAWGVTRLLSKLLLARIFEGVGESLLGTEGLRGFWTWFLNQPVVAWFGLDKYAILGGAVVGLILGAALVIPVRLAVISYRRWLHEKVSSNRFFRWLTSFWFVKVLKFIFVGTKL
jgi:uncharacterized protein (TIGR03546 family)